MVCRVGFPSLRSAPEGFLRRRSSYCLSRRECSSHSTSTCSFMRSDERNDRFMKREEMKRSVGTFVRSRRSMLLSKDHMIGETF